MNKPIQPIQINVSGKDEESNETRPKLISNEKSTVVNSVSAEVSPIQPGLTIASVPDESHLLHLMFSFITLAMKRSRELGIPMPETESVTSVHSGNPRDLDAVERFATANPNNKNWAPHLIKTFAAHHKLDWTSPEGQQLWRPIVEGANGSVVFLDLVIHGPITPAVSQGLIQIGNEAKKAGAYVMLIVACSGKQQKSQLSYLCDEYIEVNQCEADAGVDIAFSIDCVGIRDLNSLGIGKTMVDIKTNANGIFRRRYAPFISANHETRIMWYLRGQQNTLEEIGSRLKINRSTVLRRLQGLPAPRSVDWDPNWLDRNLG